ncbi:MAG: DUF5658 family protein [Methanoregula sp.]|jgi:hypothetical protein
MAAERTVLFGEWVFPSRDGTDREVSWWIILFSIVLAVLFMIDILSTQVILGMGGVELNPVMVGIVTTPLLHVLLKSGILMVVIPVALIAEARVRGSGVALYVILIAMYTTVIINNAVVLIPHIVRPFTG